MDNLQEAYLSVYEATAMAKRGLNEPAIRQKIAKSTGGGEAADRATDLEKKSTFGDANKQKQRERYARAQRGDFRNTTSSNPGLHGYGHQSDDSKVKALQSARGAQRGSAALTPKEKQQFNREEFDYESVVEYLFVEGFADTIEKAEVMAENISETWVNEIMEARASERRGLGSPERRLPSGQLVGSRGERKRKGEMGGRHFWSGGEGGSRTERGVKKNEPGSQHSRLNPPEEGGRQLKRGSKAAMQRWHTARD